MNLLCFDASTPVCPIAGGSAGTGAPTVHDTTAAGANQASEDLDRRLAAALDGLGSLDAVACGRGPGTFTGIRVALATAMGLCLGRSVPLFTFSSLAALAASAGVSGRIVAALDARRGEVYRGTFRVDLDRGQVEALDDEACTPASAAHLPGDLHVGSGFDAHAESGSPPTHRPGVVLTPAGIWVAGRSAVESTPAERANPAAARAVYLRRSYAELGLNKPRQPVRRSPFLDS